MQSQNRAERKSHTVLIVEPDEATRRILDLSLRNAGFAVGVASGSAEAATKLAPIPDLLIASVDEAGLGLCRQVKQATGGLPPAVVLISDPDVDSKRRGLEAGADDFVARPIYVQEVVARARALLQRRERERIEHAAQRNERFSSSVDDVPLVDLLRAIALNQKSGVATLLDGAGMRGEIFFRQGRVVDAEVGRLSGRDAVYRLFCWPAGQLDVDWKSIRRKDTIETAPQDLIMEALRRVDEWRRLLTNVPPVDTVLEVDYRLLAERLADIPDEANRILRLFDGMRTVMQVIDDCGLPDLDAVAAIGKLCRDRIVHDVRVPVEEEPNVGPEMEGWLTEAAGPFRSSQRMERELFLGTAGGMRGPGRSTAPLEPLGESAREAAVDAEMQVRFTDRLRAEAPPEPVGFLDAPGEPLPERTPTIEVPSMDSGPADGSARPTTLPGIGGADELAASAELDRAEEAVQPPETFPARSAPPRLGEEDGLALSRGPRITSGEIFVKPSVRPSAADGWTRLGGAGSAQASSVHALSTDPALDAPLPEPEDDDGSSSPTIRPSQSATPAGSARALDEPPPFADELLGPPTRVALVPRQPEPRLQPASPPSALDDDDAFDEPPPRRRLAWVGLLAILALGGGALLARSRLAERSMAIAHSEPSGPAAPGPATAQVEPLGAAPAGPAAAAAAAPVPDRGDRGDSKLLPATALSPRDDGDERSADPKLARARVAEAGPLLAACHAAFSEGRMKDAEAACVAARDANPDSAEAAGLLAHALYNRGHRREALGAAERAVKINPKWADAYVIIGGVHQDAGELDDAKRAYDRYLELEPKGQYARDLRSIVGKFEPAKL
jgi:CheY-like chemotaxis protein